jgi:hypothetical protein
MPTPTVTRPRLDGEKGAARLLRFFLGTKGGASGRREIRPTAPSRTPGESPDEGDLRRSLPRHLSRREVPSGARFGASPRDPSPQSAAGPPWQCPGILNCRDPAAGAAAGGGVEATAPSPSAKTPGQRGQSPAAGRSTTAPRVPRTSSTGSDSLLDFLRPEATESSLIRDDGGVARDGSPSLPRTSGAFNHDTGAGSPPPHRRLGGMGG